MNEEKILSHCCNFRVEVHKSPYGEYHWCRWCNRQLTPDGKADANRRDHGYSPMIDIERAHQLVKDAQLSMNLMDRGYSNRDNIMNQRAAFFAGACFRERVTNLSGDSFIRYEAMRLYPFPNGEPKSSPDYERSVSLVKND